MVFFLLSNVNLFLFQMMGCCIPHFWSGRGRFVILKTHKTRPLPVWHLGFVSLPPLYATYSDVCASLHVCVIVLLRDRAPSSFEHSITTDRIEPDQTVRQKNKTKKKTYFILWELFQCQTPFFLSLCLFSGMLDIGQYLYQTNPFIKYFFKRRENKQKQMWEESVLSLPDLLVLDTSTWVSVCLTCLNMFPCDLCSSSSACFVICLYFLFCFKEKILTSVVLKSFIKVVAKNCYGRWNVSCQEWMIERSLLYIII